MPAGIRFVMCGLPLVLNSGESPERREQETCGNVPEVCGYSIAPGRW
jgi:hypothetical protein